METSAVAQASTVQILQGERYEQKSIAFVYGVSAARWYQFRLPLGDRADSTPTSQTAFNSQIVCAEWVAGLIWPLIQNESSRTNTGPRWDCTSSVPLAIAPDPPPIQVLLYIFCVRRIFSS